MMMMGDQLTCIVSFFFAGCFVISPPPEALGHYYEPQIQYQHPHHSPHNGWHRYRLPVQTLIKPVDLMSDIINSLGTRILQQYVDNGNVAFSPAGLGFIMAALYEGSAGRSRQQIVDCLGFPRDRSIVRMGLGDIHRSLRTYLNPDGFLGGLNLNRENTNLRPDYENALKIYGFDLSFDLSNFGPNGTNSFGLRGSQTTTQDTTTDATTVPPTTPPSLNVDVSLSVDGVTVATTTVDNSADSSMTTTTIAPPGTTIPPTTVTVISASATAAAAQTATPTTMDTQTATMATITTTTTVQPPTTTVNANDALRSTTAASMTTTMQSVTETTTPGDDGIATVAPSNISRKRRRVVAAARRRRSNDGYLPNYPAEEGLWMQDLNVWADQPALPSNVKDATELQFLANGCDPVQVPAATYTTVLPFAYFPSIKAVGLEFPLDNPRYSVLLFLPTDTRVDTTRLARDLTTQNLRLLRKHLQPTWIRATIPSFMLRGFVTLTPYLQRLGIKDVFEPRLADLTPMTPDLGVYARDVQQSVAVNLKNFMNNSTNANNENNNNNNQQQQQQQRSEYRYLRPANGLLDRLGLVTFTAEHPFLYFIIDNDTSVSLIAGRIDDPLNSRIL